jgi:hypothetical protein
MPGGLRHVAAPRDVDIDPESGIITNPVIGDWLKTNGAVNPLGAVVPLFYKKT